MGHFDNNDIVSHTHDFDRSGRLNPIEDTLAGVRWSEIETEANDYADAHGGASRSGAAREIARPMGCGKIAMLGIVGTILVVQVIVALCSFIYDNGWLVGIIEFLVLAAMLAIAATLYYAIKTR